MADPRSERLRLTANQVVAHNLRLARLQRRWTQQQAAARLEPYLGVRWSKATYSAAERSAERSDRVRQFTADDLLAFSAAFDVPVQYFLMPPLSQQDAHVCVAASEHQLAETFELAAYLDTVFGSDEGTRRLQRRLKAALKSIPPTAEAQKLRETTQGLIEARLLEHKEELQTWNETLAALLSLILRVQTDLFHEEAAEWMTHVFVGLEKLRQPTVENQGEGDQGT